jgi:hypothetical protein
VTLNGGAGPRPGSGGPPLVRTGEVGRGTPGARWWSYQRPEVPPAPRPEEDAGAGAVAPVGGEPPVLSAAAVGVGGGARPRGTATAATIAALLLGVGILIGRVGSSIAPALACIEIAAVVLCAGVVGPRVARLHPDEGWVGRWLAWGVVAKIFASHVRFLTLQVGYEGLGDATGYHEYGVGLLNGWRGVSVAPELEDLRRTNFVRWFTGALYYVFGADMLLGFVLFGLIAVAGSYLWYRATVDAVPFIDKRLYLALVLFVPSIAFWPSSIGKESLMQLGIGVMAFATSRLLRQQLLRGLAAGAAGGWLLWVVRPHLFALVTLAGGIAYIAARSQGRRGARSLLSRPAGMIIIGFLVVFAVSEGADFLGIEELSIASIEAELDEQSERTAGGGSEFDPGGNSLHPFNLPKGAATVLLRPFPWETETRLQLLSSLESVMVAGFILFRLPSLRRSLRESRRYGFLLYCWVLTFSYAATFSSFANFGLLVRQRSLVLPALFVLLAVQPTRADRRGRHAEPLPPPPPAATRTARVKA